VTRPLPPRWERRVREWLPIDHIEEACDLLELVHEDTGNRNPQDIAEAQAHTAIARAKMLGRIRA